MIRNRNRRRAALRLTAGFLFRPVMLRMTAPFMQRSLGKIGSQSASPYTRRTPLSLPFLTKEMGYRTIWPLYVKVWKCHKTSPPCVKGGKEGGIVSRFIRFIRGNADILCNTLSGLRFALVTYLVEARGSRRADKRSPSARPALRLLLFA